MHSNVQLILLFSFVSCLTLLPAGNEDILISGGGVSKLVSDNNYLHCLLLSRFDFCFSNNYVAQDQFSSLGDFCSLNFAMKCENLFVRKKNEKGKGR